MDDPQPIKHPPFDGEATEVDTIQFLATLVYYNKPHVIVESGTYMGHFALFCLAACPNTIIFTADPRQYHEMTVREMAEANGLDPSRIIEYRGTFQAMLAEYQDSLYGNIEFAFVDSGPVVDERNAYCMEEVSNRLRFDDYHAVKPYMSYNGIVAVHDMNQCGWPGHQEIWDEGVHLLGGRGITLWQRRDL